MKNRENVMAKGEKKGEQKSHEEKKSMKSKRKEKREKKSKLAERKKAHLYEIPKKTKSGSET